MIIHTGQTMTITNFVPNLALKYIMKSKKKNGRIILNKYILFNDSFVTEDSNYIWAGHVKYGIIDEDEKNYYIRKIKDNIKTELYPIPKDLEFQAYITGEIIKGV